MKTVYIFTRLPNAHAPKRMVIEVEKLGHKAVVIDYSQVVFKLDKDIAVFVNGQELDLPHTVIFRSPGIDGFCTATRDTLLFWLKKNNARVLNGDTFARWSTLDKLTQHLEFQKTEIPFIESKVYTDINLLRDSESVFPLVVKSYLGSHGDNVKKIKNKNDFKILKQADAPFLVQPFLKAGMDVRVIILGDKVLGAMLRSANEGEFLTNYSAGGQVSLFDLNKDKEISQIALTTAKHFECEYAGVDLMQDDSGVWRVLEINRSCQFEGFEKATGENVASKLITYLLG